MYSENIHEIAKVYNKKPEDMIQELSQDLITFLRDNKDFVWEHTDCPNIFTKSEDTDEKFSDHPDYQQFPYGSLLSHDWNNTSDLQEITPEVARDLTVYVLSAYGLEPEWSYEDFRKSFIEEPI